MAFRTAFIGINKHFDPGIPELTGACRDAAALHALFADTFNDIRATLLLDEAATLDAIRAVLDDALGQVTEDDVVVLSSAGHGTPGHQIVAYDTDRDSPGDTPLPMDELAARFQTSKARAVLCVIDCCFSGAAPARVLEGMPVSRADLNDYSAFAGKERFLLAAASPIQPAWEEPTGAALNLPKETVRGIRRDHMDLFPEIAAAMLVMIERHATETARARDALKAWLKTHRT